MQACLFLPGPPNFTMSKQYLHCPQSSLVQAEQLPHRPRFLSPIATLVLYLHIIFVYNVLGFEVGHFSCLTINLFVTSLLRYATFNYCVHFYVFTFLCRGFVSCFSIMWISVPQ